ncbi:hypothetical protein VCRA2116O29_220042 [Vibrio crassostreae]|nr:hypothetical protein VCRA2116O29_220042 [Vibrio crassostreae]CAK3698431.1 hypothetical protein VCRA2123O74_210040 [Vibrio crassostreae]
MSLMNCCLIGALSRLNSEEIFDFMSTFATNIKFSMILITDDSFAFLGLNHKRYMPTILTSNLSFSVRLLKLAFL